MPQNRPGAVRTNGSPAAQATRAIRRDRSRGHVVSDRREVEQPDERPTRLTETDRHDRAVAARSLPDLDRELSLAIRPRGRRREARSGPQRFSCLSSSSSSLVWSRPERISAGAWPARHFRGPRTTCGMTWADADAPVPVECLALHHERRLSRHPPAPGASVLLGTSRRPSDSVLSPGRGVRVGPSHRRPR